MRLTAEVRHVTGATTHHAGPVQLKPATRAEIVEADGGGFLLIRYALESFAGDTWHATAEEAKRQAEMELAIPPLSWKEEPDA